MKKTSFLKSLAIVVACGLITHASFGQSLTVLTNLQTAIPLITGGNVLNGTPVQFQGQTFLISTNATGGLEVKTFGVAGTNVMTAPANPQDALNVATAWLAANNPANIGYYGTNEINARVGLLYLQNSGKAVASIGVQKYGLFSMPNFGVGIGVLQGNNGGKSGTAAAFGEALYRKPIGDVAACGGIIGGYDKWNSQAFGGAKAGLEYRKSKNLGAWIDVIYVYERSDNSDKGLIIGGGVSYAF
jgi:hypothetical protein